MLALKDLHVNYGSISALRGISLEITSGEMVGLIGVNGAGKTTTLLAIAGVLRPTKGIISFEENDIVGKSPEEIIRLGIALVPEGRRIFPGLTVEENLRLGAAIRSDRQEIQRDIDEICTRFPILGERHKQPGGTLSGGEQQQLAIARANVSPISSYVGRAFPGPGAKTSRGYVRTRGQVARDRCDNLVG